MTRTRPGRGGDRDARPAPDFKARQATVEAVRGVDLKVQAGEIFGFLGPNGAGKTTTLRMLATLLTPTGGRPPSPASTCPRSAEVRRRIGYVPQGGSTDPAETGRGELVIQGRLYGMDKSAAERRADRGARGARPDRRRGPADRHLLGRHAPPARRRARHRPSPARPVPRRADDRPRPAGPGPDVGRVPRLRELGTTVFLTTHYLEEADALADRLAIIDHGRIVAEGTADELKRQVAGDVVTIGVDGDHERVLALVRAEPFVREASADDELIRLYVDQGDAPCRSSSGCSTEPTSRPHVDARPAEPRRRLPAPDRPLAARRGRGMTATTAITTTQPITTARNPPCSSSATPGSSSIARSG